MNDESTSTTVLNTATAALTQVETRAEGVIESLIQWLETMGLGPWMAAALFRTLAIIAIIVLAWIANTIAKQIIVRVVRVVIKRTPYTWDDIFVQRQVFTRLSHLAPALIIYAMAGLAFSGMKPLIEFTRDLANAYMIVIVLIVIEAILSAVLDIYARLKVSRRVSIKPYIQIVKVALFIVGAFMILGLFTSAALGLLTGLGALTAILLLIFRDAILGLVASVQLAANNMVRVGDWIEMPKFGVDGDVIDVSLTTVKIQNFDKTILTIPAYALISDSFKNWRGMSESEGRRIKRSVFLDMNTIKFCNGEMLDRFRKIQYITEYIERKKGELTEYNQQHNVDDASLVNGRRMTNIGTFRAYVEAYLHNHPKIHQEMTFLIRQLQPTEHGLPLELYVFSNDQVWANYEAIQADIFDHILAVLSEFDLRVFQQPTGADFTRSFAKSETP